MAFPGLIRNVEQRYRETGSEAMKQEYESFMRITPCTTCKGQRLKKESLAVTVADKNIYEVTNMPVQKLQGFLRDLKLSKQQELIGRQILKEIRARIWISGRGWPGVSFTWKSYRNPFRRRGSEDPSCHTDRIRACGGCIYPG